jgi:MFS family permease
MRETSKSQKPKLGKQVWRLGWISLFNDIATEMSYPLLPAFLATMGAAGVWLGWVEGIAESVSALVKYVSGLRSDRGTVRKPYVVAGYASSSLVRPLLALATAPWQVVVLRASDRVGKGVRSAPRDALLAASISPDVAAYAFGFHQMMDNLGAVIGPLVAFALAREAHFSMRAIFACALLPGLVTVAILIWGVNERPRRGHDENERPQSKNKSSAKQALDSRVKSYLLAVAIFSLGSSADSFLLLRLTRQHLAVALVPIAWLSLNAMKALTNVAGGKLSDRVGHKWTLLGGWSLYAIIYAILPLAHTYQATWLVMLAYGFYYGLTEGAEKALLMAIAPEDQRGRAFGAFHAITGAAVLPANAVFGFVFDKNPEIAFWIGAGFAGLGALILLFVNPLSAGKDA